MSPIKAANKILTLWQTHGPNTPNVDIELVVESVVNPASGADRLNIHIDDLEDIDGAMVGSTENANSFTAVVNRNITNVGRRRFTLAHEVGHFILHREKQRSFKCTREMFGDFDSDGLEAEANQFAAQLLLPPNKVREYSSRPWNLETLQEIADKFQVSLQAAGLRMAKLSERPIAFVVSTSDIVEWGASSAKLYKRGCFFRSMDEVPVESSAYGTDFSHEGLEIERVLESVWRIQETFKEISMLGYDGRIYTCIDVT